MKLQQEIQGERRTVTVLFADLSNYTGLGERLDPEDVAVLIRECFGGVIDEIRARDGWIQKHIGDAVVAVFGAPVAHEDDPSRAVEAALGIRERVQLLHVRVGERIGGPLDVHVGINTGLAVIAPAVERGDGDDFIVIGDSVTTAARLQQAARPGQILVGESTYSATRRRYAYQELAPLKLKGKQDRVRAWACLGERSTDGGGLDEVLPLVGRVRERAAAERGLQMIATGRGSVLLLTGGAGVGKTRLLAEVRVQAREHGLLWVEGGTVSFGEPVAYAPFIDALHALTGIAGEDDATAWQKLELRVRELFAAEEVDEVLPYLGTLLALELPNELAASVQYVEGEGLGLQIFRAVRLLFERLARRQPIALAFEDWHWTDESSAALLEHLVPLVESLPILICCSSRPGPSPASALRNHAATLGIGDRVIDVELAALSRGEAHELIRNLAGRALPSQLDEQIVEKTEGNPFFIEEIVRALLDSGVDVDQLEIPDTLRGAIIARVDRLPQSARRVLRIASVLGRTFSDTLLRELAVGEDVGGALARSTEADIVRDAPHAGEAAYIFKHAITQNVIYENVLLSHRRELHRAVAQLLERRFPDRLDELAGTVAFHYTQAEEWEAAQEFLFRAGDHAGSVAASSEALAYYSRALEAYSGMAGANWNALQRAELDRKIGEAFFRRGEHDQATHYLERALACFGFSYPETTTGVRLAIVRAAARQLLHRLLPLPRYRGISATADPWMDELSRTLDTLGWIYFFSNPERVVLDSFRQLNAAERRGHRLAIVRASTGLGFTFDALPVPPLASRYHRRAVGHSAHVENRRSVGVAYLGLAHHQRYQLAAFDDALTNYARAADECRRAGDLRGRMGATLMLAEVTGLTGDLEASLGHGRLLIEIGEDAGDNQVRGWGHHAIGRTLRLAGEFEEAAMHLERGCEFSQAVPDFQALVVARGNVGLLLLEQGRLDEALAVLEATHAFVQERRLRTFAFSDLLKALASAYVLAAERADSGERDALMRRARSSNRALARQVRLDRAAAPAALRSRGAYQWVRGHDRRAIASWRRSAARAEFLGLPRELAVTQLEAGRRTGDAGLVAAASAQLGHLAATVKARAASKPLDDRPVEERSREAEVSWH